MIWDCVLVGYEADIDMLVCRMTQLDGIVDRFVLADSPTTFAGTPKPSHVQDNLHRLLPWRDKITWLHGSNEPLPEYPRDTEFFAREVAQGELYRAALADAQPDDIVLIGGADEIPRRQDFRPGTVLGQRMHVYDLRTVCQDVWPGTAVFRAGDFRPGRSLIGQYFDYRYGAEQIPDAGWHLTYFGGPAAVAEKVLSIIPGRDTDSWRWDFRPLHDYYGQDYPAWVLSGDCPLVWWDACPYGLVGGSDSSSSAET